jgi:hypothetical protein
VLDRTLGKPPKAVSVAGSGDVTPRWQGADAPTLLERLERGRQRNAEGGTRPADVRQPEADVQAHAADRGMDHQGRRDTIAPNLNATGRGVDDGRRPTPLMGSIRPRRSCSATASAPSRRLGRRQCSRLTASSQFDAARGKPVATEEGIEQRLPGHDNGEESQKEQLH